MHTAARPAGQHSEFYPHLGWQAARRSCPRYALAGSRSHRGKVAGTRGYVDFARLYVLHQARSRTSIVTRANIRTSMLILASSGCGAVNRIARPASFATRPSHSQTANLQRGVQDYSRTSAAHVPASRTHDVRQGRLGLHLPTYFSLPVLPPSARSTKAAGRWTWTLLTKVETSCDRILIAGGANVEAEWEQGPAV